QRTRMADHHRACLRWAQRTDLAECRFHLVDHELLTCHIASPCVSNPLRLPRFIPYLLTYRVTSPKHRVTGNSVAMALPRPISTHERRDENHPHRSRHQGAAQERARL